MKLIKINDRYIDISKILYIDRNNRQICLEGNVFVYFDYPDEMESLMYWINKFSIIDIIEIYKDEQK